MLCLISELSSRGGAQAWTYNYSITPNRRWPEASKWCQEHFTGMVLMRSQEETDFLNSLLPLNSKYYWTGIRKDGEDWIFDESNIKVPEDAQNWAPQEPDTFAGQDCVEVYIKREMDTAKWNNENCRKKKGTVCYTGKSDDFAHVFSSSVKHKACLTCLTFDSSLCACSLLYTRPLQWKCSLCGDGRGLHLPVPSGFPRVSLWRRSASTIIYYLNRTRSLFERGLTTRWLWGYLSHASSRVGSEAAQFYIKNTVKLDRKYMNMHSIEITFSWKCVTQRYELKTPCVDIKRVKTVATGFFSDSSHSHYLHQKHLSFKTRDWKAWLQRAELSYSSGLCWRWRWYRLLLLFFQRSHAKSC